MSVTAVVAGQGRGAPTPAPAAKAAAPIDVTGYWVAVVNKEWRFRMVIPAKGDFFGPIGGIPINAEARRVAEAWDPAKDEKAGEACKGFGAAGLMRVPGRLRIGWQDDNTLRVDTDAGMQTRVLHFGTTPPRGRASWQGDSVARWLGLPSGGTGGRAGVSSEGTRVAGVRQLRGRDDEHASGLPAQEWRALQCERLDDGVLERLQRTGRNRLARHRRDGRGPDVSADAV